MTHKPTLDALGNPLPLGLIENQKEFYRRENFEHVNPQPPQEEEEKHDDEQIEDRV